MIPSSDFARNGIVFGRGEPGDDGGELFGAEAVSEGRMDGGERAVEDGEEPAADDDRGEEEDEIEEREAVKFVTCDLTFSRSAQYSAGRKESVVRLI
jgi:hypothetical protein